MGRRAEGRLGFLDPEARSGFLFLALHDGALRRACRKLGLSFPGYRLEKIPAGDLADALAREYDLDPAVADHLERLLDEACTPPVPLPASRLPAPLIETMVVLAMTAPERSVTPLLWRLFGSRDAAVRRAGEQGLHLYMSLLDEAAQAAPDEHSRGRPGQGAAAGPAPAGAARSELRRRLKEAEARFARLEGDLGSLQEQVAAERRQVALRDERLSRARESLEKAQEELRASEQDRAALRARIDRDAAADLRRLEAERERLLRDVAALRSELEAARRREAELVGRLRALESAPAPRPAATPEAPPEPAGAWLLPVFTGEFYESIRKWDARLVRGAFEKVLLLCQNPAHPGIDARPIQGADGLYRIFVAQDVRLFYRRPPGGRLEILSLIDREDLERYIRSYKARVVP